MNSDLPTTDQKTPDSGNRFALLLATGLGVGYCPVIPGTVGSLWGIPLVLLLDWLQVPWWGCLEVAGVLFFAGIPICSLAAKRLGKQDPGEIVWDEIAAFPLVFLPPVWMQIPLDWRILAAGFVWFRLFDITKPWPIRNLDRMHGGLGIMADDTIAGLYAAIALCATTYLINAL